MAKLSKPQQQPLLLFTGTVLGLFVGYLINQLPNIPDFPNKAQIVIGSVTLLTLISFFVAWKLARLDGEGSVDKPLKSVDQQSRKKLLERLRKTWISGVLEKSLYHEARVELVLKDQMQETLPPGTRVIQKLNELGEGGTMLILGEPGSGKTTTLLELARDLLEGAQQDADAPLPVVLHLAAWNRSDRKKCSWLRFGRSKPEPQKLENWVIEELNNSPVIEDLTGKDRHYEIPRKVTQYWLREQRLVLLLDGLDEVAPEQREDCVKAINEFRQAYSLVEMVVGCRMTDYRELKAKLEFQQELMIQPLTLQQIEDYLKKTTGNLSAIKNILPNEILQKIANSPFTLWILSLAYNDDSAGQLLSEPPDKRIKFLLNLYIYQQLKPPKEYIRHQRKDIRFSNFRNQQEAQLIWIKRLAKNLKSNFSINQIDIFWIIKNSNNKMWHQKTIAAINVLLILGLVMLGFVFINNESIPKSGWSRYFSFFSVGVILIVMIDYIFASFVEYPIERFIINEKPLELIRAYILAFWNVLTSDLNEINRGNFGFPGLIFITFFSFFFSIQSSPYIQRLPQNIIQIPPTWLIFLMLWFVHILFCLMIGLAVTFFIRLVSHYLLRALLTNAGILPWNNHQFLDWICDRFILQKIGDSYIFIHPMLREHFAQMDIDAFIQWADAKPN